MGTGRETVGGEQASALDSASGGGAVSLGIADHEVRARANRGKSSEKDGEAHPGGKGSGCSHRAIITHLG